MPCANCRRVLTALPDEDGNINGGDHCSTVLVRNSESEEACVGQKESIPDVAILDAISTVFEASLKLHKKTVPPDSRLLMCFQCLSTLTTLNSSYKKFMKLTVEGSYVQTLLESSILWSSSVTNSDYKPFEDDGVTPEVEVKLESVEVEDNFSIIQEQDPFFAIDQDPLSTEAEGEVLLRNSTRKMKASKSKDVKQNTVKQFRKILPAPMRVSSNPTSDSTKVVQQKMSTGTFRNSSHNAKVIQQKMQPTIFCNSTSHNTKVIQQERQPGIFRNSTSHSTKVIQEKVQPSIFCNSTSHSTKVIQQKVQPSIFCNSTSTSHSTKVIQQETQPIIFRNSTSHNTKIIQQEMQPDIFPVQDSNISLESPTSNCLITEHPSVSDEDDESAQNVNTTNKIQQKQNSIQSSITMEPLVCPHDCGETPFSSEANFRQHMMCVHREKPSFKCEECGKIFAQRARQRRHLKYQHGHGLTAKDMEGRSCPVCHKTFETRGHLRLHQNSAHNIANPFQCEVEGCGRKFPTLNYLTTHRRQRHTDERYPCEFCGKLLRGKNVLQFHIKTVHDGIRDVICETCGKACATKSELKKHVKTHDKTRQRSFECNVCSKAYLDAKSLRSHILKHSGVKSKLCTYCGDSFFEAMALQRHLVAKHGVRPTTGPFAKERHECRLCGKVFKLKDYLNQHMMSKMHGGKGRIAPKKKVADDP